MKNILTWLRGPEEREIELLPDQQTRFDNAAWRDSNSKWNYIVWLSFGMYAGLALLFQGARAGSRSTVTLGLIHLALFMMLVPIASIVAESFDFVLIVFAVFSLVVCGTGVIFTFWSNPKILRWKASRLQIVSAETLRETGNSYESIQGQGDLRADERSSGPRKLDF
jgi:hypothetical protein